MRLVAGFTLAEQGVVGLRGEPQLERVILSVLAAAAGILLIAGLWTPSQGRSRRWLSYGAAFSQPGDPLTHVLLGTLGAAVALVGPGAGRSTLAFLYGSVSTSEIGRASVNHPVGDFSLPQRFSRSRDVVDRVISMQGWPQAGVAPQLARRYEKVESARREGVNQWQHKQAGRLRYRQSTIPHPLKSKIRRRRKSRSTATNSAAADCLASSVTATLYRRCSAWYRWWLPPTPRC